MGFHRTSCYGLPVSFLLPEYCDREISRVDILKLAAESERFCIDNFEQYDTFFIDYINMSGQVELLGMQVIDELIQDEVSYYKDIYEENGIQGILGSYGR
jgi:hypothetical protein